MTISELASIIRGEIKSEKEEDNDQRLTDTLDKFNEDFKDVILELICCGVKYEACFLHKKEDGEYYFYPQDTKFNGSVCVCNSILFTFEHNGEKVRKRIFYSTRSWDNQRWYYIARSGNNMNANIYFEDLRKDLILYLDGKFEGEYK